MAFQVAADHPQVAGFGYLVANLATLVDMAAHVWTLDPRFPLI